MKYVTNRLNETPPGWWIGTDFIEVQPEDVGKVLGIIEDEDGNPAYGLVSNGGGTVDSVNGKTGAVVLDAEDVGAASANAVYTKTEIDQKLVGAMRYKGVKATTSDLSSTGNTQGDVWHITADGSEWAWNGSAWENLGTVVDIAAALAAYRTASAQDVIDGAQDVAIAAKYAKPSSGIPKTDLASAVQTSLGKADTAYQKPSDGIPASDLASGVIPTIPVSSVNGKTGAVVLDADDIGAYKKPATGIPKSDLASAVQTSLGKADSALQSVPNTYRTASAQDVIDNNKEDKSNKVTSISAQSTDVQYPSAKCVYDAIIGAIEEAY